MSPIAPFLAPERDDRLKLGRPKPNGGTQAYVIPGITAGQASTEALTLNRDYLMAWKTDTPLIIDQLAAEITTNAGTNFRIGFYRADANWQPVGAPMADSGNLDATSAAVKTYTPGTPVYVPRGRYLSIVNCDGSPTLRSSRGNFTGTYSSSLGTNNMLQYMYVARTYAAFTTPATVWDTITYSNIIFPPHVVYYRVSTP